MEKSLVTHFLMVLSPMISLTSDQNFVDVLDEIASTRGWQGEAVELHVQDPNSGEEYPLNSGIYPPLNPNLTTRQSGI